MPNHDFSGIRLIVGLGNPGEEYVRSRHNAGFAMIDAFLEKAPKSNFAKIHGCKSFYWRGAYAGKPLFLQKPWTYMNLSGEAVALLANSEQIQPEEIMVVYDDMDLPLGKLRIRKNGGSGGHNGINSIIDCLGTENFPRLRFGIGKMENGRGSAGFVLSEFTEEEKPLFEKVRNAAADAMILCLRRGISMAMNVYNAKDFAETEEEKSGKAAESEETKQNNSNTTNDNTTHQEV